MTDTSFWFGLSQKSHCKYHLSFFLIKCTFKCTGLWRTLRWRNELQLVFGHDDIRHWSLWRDGTLMGPPSGTLQSADLLRTRVRHQYRAVFSERQPLRDRLWWLQLAPVWHSIAVRIWDLRSHRDHGRHCKVRCVTWSAILISNDAQQAALIRLCLFLPLWHLCFVNFNSSRKITFHVAILCTS